MSTRGGYDVVPVVKTPRVDRGETVKIDVYCTSAGIPPGNTLTFGYDSRLTDPDDGDVWVQLNGGDAPRAAPGHVHAPVADGGAVVELPLTGPEQTIRETSLAPIRFFTHAEGASPDVATPSERSTTPHRIRPPAEIELRTAPTCPPGDYEIPFVFSFESEDGTEHLVRRTAVHVNSFTETHRWALAGVFLFVLLVGALVAMI